MNTSSPEGNLKALVDAAARGEADAICVLAHRYRALVRSVAMRNGLGPTEVDDVVQETWLKLITHAGDIREAECLPGWLRRIAHNVSLSRLRERSRMVLIGHGEKLTDSCGEADPCADAVIARAEEETLSEAIERLNSRDRRLVQLLMIRTPYREISAQLGMKIGSIGPTRERILEKLGTGAALCSFARINAA